jgi:hypothetical protein
LARHDRVLNTLAAKKSQESAELPDAHPLEDIHVSLENWISFVREGGSDHFFNAGSTRSIGEQSRVNAVAGDNSQSV